MEKMEDKITGHVLFREMSPNIRTNSDFTIGE
jgi:hypothetical protein